MLIKKSVIKKGNDDSKILIKKSTLAMAVAGGVIVGGAAGYALAKGGKGRCTVQ